MGPQKGKVTCGGSPHLSCKRDQIEMRNYMDRRVTSPTWDPPPPRKQDLTMLKRSNWLCHKDIAILCQL